LKTADKGGSIVVQDRSAYVQEIERQLGDINFYARLQCDATMKFNEEIKTKLKRAVSNAIINEKEYGFLLQTNPLDTTDFLMKLSCIGEICTTDLLYSMDVTKLYINIPHDAGLVSLEYYLQINPVPHTEFLLSLANEVLTKNYFMFQNIFFSTNSRHCHGFALGA